MVAFYILLNLIRFYPVITYSLISFEITYAITKVSIKVSENFTTYFT
ncbi:hypothetical protein E27107_280300 [Elizabethkingia anophelis]|nr:hypothetical protein E18064_290301 [Elizabethkingia anophelis]CDN78265.1 hypothetical protein E27107_280300 [Elizabethkingia anophelis]